MGEIMSQEGAVVIEEEAAAVPLYGRDHPVVLEKFRQGGVHFSGMELLQGLLSEPNPCSRRGKLQNGEETTLFLRVQHAESLFALICSCFSMERFPVPCQLPFHNSQKYSCVSQRHFQ